MDARQASNLAQQALLPLLRLLASSPAVVRYLLFDAPAPTTESTAATASRVLREPCFLPFVPQVECLSHVQPTLQQSQGLRLRLREAFKFRLHIESNLSLPSLVLPAGRYPNTRNLGLEEVGVEMDKAGNIKVGEA